MKVSTKHCFLLLLSISSFVILGLSSCSNSDSISGEEHFTGTNIINNLVTIEETEKKKEKEVISEEKEDIEDFFKDVEFIEDDLDDTKESEVGASLVLKTYNGSSYGTTTVDVLYHVSGFIKNPTDTITINNQVYSKGIEFGDYLNEFAIVFDNNNSLAFDSISYKANALEQILVEQNNDGVGVKFGIYFEKLGSDSKTSRLKYVFQEKELFSIAYAYVVKKKDGPYITVKSSFNQNSRLPGQYLFKWQCLESDWTFVQNNFRDQVEKFPENQYAHTLSGHVLNDRGDCIYGDDGYCIEASPVATGDDFIDGILIGDARYRSGSILSIDYSFMGSGALCAVYDDFSHSGTTAAQCWENEFWRGSSDTRGRVVFRPKEDSFCVTEESIYLEEFYPRIACNLEKEEEVVFEIHTDTGADSTSFSNKVCWNNEMINWDPTTLRYLAKWQDRHCVVEDYRCKGTDPDCGREGTCWWGCGVGNDIVLKREGVDCFDESGSGEDARFLAKQKCTVSTFTGLLSSGTNSGNYLDNFAGFSSLGLEDYYCRADDAYALQCNSTDGSVLKRGCECGSANKWGDPGCYTPPVTAEGCGLRGIRFNNVGCSTDQEYKEICDSLGNWLKDPEYGDCARECTYTGATYDFAGDRVTPIFDPYKGDLDLGEQFFFKNDEKEIVGDCKAPSNRVKMKCTMVQEDFYGEDIYKWIASNNSDVEKQHFSEETCTIKCKVYQGGYLNPDYTTVSDLLDGTKNTIVLYKTNNDDCADITNRHEIDSLTCRAGVFYDGTNPITDAMYELCHDCEPYPITDINATNNGNYNSNSNQKQYTYDDSANYGPCTWKCNSGYVQDIANGNACITGP